MATATLVDFTSTLIPPEESLSPHEETFIPPEKSLIPPEESLVPPEESLMLPEEFRLVEGPSTSGGAREAERDTGRFGLGFAEGGLVWGGPNN